MESLRIVGDLLWELAIVALACRLARRVEDEDEGAARAAPGAARLLTLTLALDLTLGALAGLVVSACRANGAATYLSLALAILAGLAWPAGRLADDLRALGTAAHRAIRAGSVVDRLAIGLLGCTALAACFRPIHEGDSQYVLFYLDRLLHNRTALHPSPWHYSMFWELSYLPGMAFTRNDHLFWLTSLKPALLLAVVLHRIGRGLGLSRGLAALASVNALLLGHHWLLAAGVGTLKNDTIHATGLGLLALGGLRMARGALGRETGLYLAVGTLFAMVKFSGFVEAAGLIGLAAVHSGRALQGRWRLAARWGCWSALLWVVGQGPWYGWNLLAHGNPLYPFPIALGPLRLPGTKPLDLAGTSILASLGDARVWSAFFPLDRVSVAGIWFPPTLGLGLAAAAWVAASGALAACRRRSVDGGLGFTAAAVLWLWFVFGRSYWGASDRPGDLYYLLRPALNSLRYAEAALGLTELFLLGLLARARWPEGGARLLLLSSMGSRVVMLHLRSDWGGAPALASGLLLAAPAALLIWAVGALRPGLLRAGLAAAALAFTACVVAPARIEADRARHWYPFWKDAWAALEALPPGRVLVAFDDRARRVLGFDQVDYHMYRYVVQGGRFDREALGVPVGWLATGRAPRADYVVLLRVPGAGDASRIPRGERATARLGFERVAGNDHCSVLRRVEPASVAATPIEGRLIR